MKIGKNLEVGCLFNMSVVDCEDIIDDLPDLLEGYTNVEPYYCVNYGKVSCLGWTVINCQHDGVFCFVINSTIEQWESFSPSQRMVLISQALSSEVSVSSSSLETLVENLYEIKYQQNNIDMFLSSGWLLHHACLEIGSDIASTNLGNLLNKDVDQNIIDVFRQMDDCNKDPW